MSLWSKIRGTIETAWQIGLGGPQLKKNGNNVDVRNQGDTAYTILTGQIEPIANDGATPLTAHGVVIAEGAAAMSVTGTGTSGQPLLSAGAAADPAYGNLAVPAGGTGATTFTAHTVLVGEGVGPIVGVGPGTSGQPLVSGGAGADPAYATLTVPGGGTGATTFTAHAVLVGEGTGAVVAVGPGTTGQVLTGVTGADPAWKAPGGIGGAMVNIAIGASPYQALAATPYVQVDVTTGNPTNLNITVAPPVNPADGAPFWIKCNLGDASAAPILIAPANGQPAIEDPSAPGTFRSFAAVASLKSGPGAFAHWTYNATLNQWLLIGAI